MSSHHIGVVVIGRNEGERLERCLRSLQSDVAALVYVDSGSIDGSTGLATRLGADVVHLDMSRPFTAARARNEGFRRLLTLRPHVQWIQFVDGDCEIVPGWLKAASEFLATHSAYAVVCGRRRERFPERSVYNRLCDTEWDTPVGDALACGGDAMMRADALQRVGGYRDGLIAGEEPELCVRLRQGGWRIHRLDHEMTLHDAAITRFAQWWRRSVRSGHAFEEGAWLHGARPERHWVRESRRAKFWGAILPAAILMAMLAFGPEAALLALIYPAQWLRLFVRHRSAAQATFLLLGKFAEAVGALKFHAARVRGVTGPIIEYK